MTTGTDVIREKLRVVAFKGHLAPLARDLDLGIGALEAFATGHAALPVPVLQKLTAELWGGAAEYDPQSNLLRSTNRTEPRPLGIAPSPLDPKAAPFYQPPRPGPAPAAPGMVAKPAPRPPRPGWATE